MPCLTFPLGKVGHNLTLNCPRPRCTLGGSYLLMSVLDFVLMHPPPLPYGILFPKMPLFELHPELCQSPLLPQARTLFRLCTAHTDNRPSHFVVQDMCSSLVLHLCQAYVCVCVYVCIFVFFALLRLCEWALSALSIVEIQL